MSDLSRQLLDQANHLAQRDARGRPQQANLRRAVSTAYYGVFHLFVDAACREFVGTMPDDRPLRDAVSRAFEHGGMKSACASFEGGQLPAALQPALRGIPVSKDLRIIARRFVQLQEERHAADYDPARSFLRHEAVGHVNDASDLLDTLWPKVSGSNEVRVFLWSLLLQKMLVRR